ncbi:hypothetical protein [Bifidobacterium moukalabense]|uniref:hypothetical protein n=1 Tax=Bifidobacterium moukalabense TaxID=1333651 RepID=UPI001FCF153E|nr:hypothetical protein [Bifidobacterium moukalabense]
MHVLIDRAGGGKGTMACFTDDRFWAFAECGWLQIWKILRMTGGQDVLHHRVLWGYFRSG